jgi:hypothetical protein
VTVQNKCQVNKYQHTASSSKQVSRGLSSSSWIQLASISRSFFPLSPSSRSCWNLLLQIWRGSDDCFRCREEVYAVSVYLVSVTPPARHVPPSPFIHPSLFTSILIQAPQMCYEVEGVAFISGWLPQPHRQ